MRHKEIKGFNAHGSVKFAIDFALALVSEKMKSRIKIYTSIESVAKTLDATLLPKEYGGITPMAEMIGQTTNILLSKLRLQCSFYHFRSSMERRIESFKRCDFVE